MLKPQMVAEIYNILLRSYMTLNLEAMNIIYKSENFKVTELKVH